MDERNPSPGESAPGPGSDPGAEVAADFGTGSHDPGPGPGSNPAARGHANPGPDESARLDPDEPSASPPLPPLPPLPPPPTEPLPPLPPAPPGALWPPPASRPSRRRVLTAVGAAALLVAVGVPTGVAVLGGDGDGGTPKGEGTDGGKAGSSGKGARTGPGGARRSPSPSMTPLRPQPPVALPGHPRLRAVGTVASPDDEVDTFSFSPDGTTLAVTGGQKGALTLWDVAARKEVPKRPLIFHETFTTVAFSPDGRTVATGGDSAARFWDARTLRPHGPALGQGDDPTAGFGTLAYSPDGRFLAVCGSSDQEVRIYDALSHRPLGQALQGSYASTLLFSPDGGTLAAVDGMSELQLWDMATRRPGARTTVSLSGGANNVAFSPDGRTLAVDGETEVFLIDVATGKRKGAPLGGHMASVTGLAFSTDGRTVLTTDYAGLHLWDTATHRKRGDTVHFTGTRATVKHRGTVTLTTPGTGTPAGLAASPDGRTLATAAFQATGVRVWRLE